MNSPADPVIAVAIVTHNAASDLPSCLEALAGQEGVSLELVIVDCASADASVAVAMEAPGPPRTVVALAENRGFAGGMNEAIEHTRAPFVLCLNADARPHPGFLQALSQRMEAHPELAVGAVTGRLVRPQAAGEARRLDACGMRLTRTWRHLDRGSGELDGGQFTRPERVFGATGAATLFRREALRDVAIDGEVFDSLFHSFREDAELCFRLRERGWEILYEPAAVAEHRRSNLPERRRRMPAAVNFHSLKNRYLLRLYHQSRGNFFTTLVPTLLRDLGAIVWVLALERSSLASYSWLWRNRREIGRRRRLIRSRRTAHRAAIERWFHTSGIPL